ncbi:16S rRNA (guanine(527)-N(7))-methyltransferase RsmG [Candidatus Binatia bacterium]|nr:16S rRNA (guanine(527)-N(7))-methyltransferase RsmG [Candidatus Binatia bacterium]
MAGRDNEQAIGTAERLHTGAQLLGVALDQEQLAALCLFVDELGVWNARTNLVGQHDRSTLIDRHVLDSLAAAPMLRDHGPALRIADVGSGAGLPGVPLAIALRTQTMWLIEPRRKRASFLRSIRRLLPTYGLEVLEARAEDLAGRRGETPVCDAVVSRAALTDEALQLVAAPLLRDGGLLIAYRGAATEDVAAASLVTTGYSERRSSAYSLEAARRSFRLDVWRRSFT